MLLEEERKDVERRHETSPLLTFRRALPSSATRDLSRQFIGFRVVPLSTSTILNSNLLQCRVVSVTVG